MKEKIELVVTSKGQTVIPKKVREMLNIEPGTRLLLKVEDKTLILKPKPKNPLKNLLELRKKIKFSEKELKQMMKASKKGWDKL